MLTYLPHLRGWFNNDRTVRVKLQQVGDGDSPYKYTIARRQVGSTTWTIEAEADHFGEAAMLVAAAEKGG